MRLDREVARAALHERDVARLEVGEVLDLAAAGGRARLGTGREDEVDGLEFVLDVAAAGVLRDEVVGSLDVRRLVGHDDVEGGGGQLAERVEQEILPGHLVTGVSERRLDVVA